LHQGRIGRPPGDPQEKTPECGYKSVATPGAPRQKKRSSPQPEP
jgi:hypothetical protein